MQKALCLRYRQLEVSGVIMYDKNRDINTVLNHCKNAFDIQTVWCLR